jgi:predicted Rossmann fold flavoprotein
MNASTIAEFDVIVIGAGAAGMFCAATAGQRGRRVLLLDHATKLAEKIRISGGGRCNFTNQQVVAGCYLSQNPHFCRSALAQFTVADFVALVMRYGIAFHEKTLGQLFCDDSALQIIDMLKAECDLGQVSWQMGTSIAGVTRTADGCYLISTTHGEFRCQSLVVATGGLSIPQIGASPFGYQLAEQFGVPMVKPRPGLVPLTFAPDDWTDFTDMAGVSLEAVVRCGKQSFREHMLFTHRGVSGPAILQISSYWLPGMAISIDLLPDHDTAAQWQAMERSEQTLLNWLAQWLPRRLVQVWLGRIIDNRPLKQYTPKERQRVIGQLHDWQVWPTGTAGYKKAEVTVGGVDTRALSSKTMMVQQQPGLYFIGEVVDVTGWLGGYNFQWAWSSGYAAGMHV